MNVNLTSAAVVDPGGAVVDRCAEGDGVDPGEDELHAGEGDEVA